MKMRKGFSLIELMVVISIIVILISFILPTITGPCGPADSVNCLYNMRELTEAQLIYALDHANRIPTSKAWLHDANWPGGWPKNLPGIPDQSALVKGGYVTDLDAFLCPCDDQIRRDRQDLTGAYAYIRPANFSYTRNAHEVWSLPSGSLRFAQLDRTALLIAPLWNSPKQPVIPKRKKVCMVKAVNERLT